MNRVEHVPILKGKNLEVKRGGTVILNVPSFQIKEGEILSLIGPNGAGKTTLLQTLSYLLKPFQGEIFFRGRKVEANHSVLEYRRRLAMVFQEPLLFDTTVFHNVASGLKIRAVALFGSDGEGEMRRVFSWLGWMLLIIGGGLVLLGVAAWPPGGLMFALPFVFLIPGVPLAVIGGGLVWLSRQRPSAAPHATNGQ